MRRVLCSLLALGSLVAGGLALAPPAAAADLGTFPGGTSVNVARDGKTRAVFPMQMRRGVPARGISVAVLDVRQDDIPSKALHAATDASFRRDLGALLVTFDDPGPEAGRYTVTVRMTRGARAQIVTVTMLRASAELTTASSISVDHVEPWWPSGEDDSDDTADGTIRLQVGPHDLVDATDLTWRENDASPGTVTLGDPTAGSGVLSYDFTFDDLPLGTSTQTIELSSPKLEDPVTVDLVVENRRTTLLIGLLVVLGLLAGWGTRRAVEPAIDRLQERNQLDLIRSDARARILATGASVNQDGSLASSPETPHELQRALAITENVPRFESASALRRRRVRAEELVHAAPVSASAPPSRGRAGAARAWDWIVLRLLKVARFVLLGAVLVITGYALHAETWTGSWEQILTVLTWAIALEVTSASVSEEVLRARQKPSADPPPVGEDLETGDGGGDVVVAPPAPPTPSPPPPGPAPAPPAAPPPEPPAAAGTPGAVQLRRLRLAVVGRGPLTRPPAPPPGALG